MLSTVLFLEEKKNSQKNKKVLQNNANMIS